MYFSRLNTPALQRVSVSQFGGLDLRERPAQNSFAAMENLCSDACPALQVRPGRGVVTTLSAPGGLSDKETLIWVDGHTLYVAGAATGVVLSEGSKQFVSMGAYLLIFPDKVWINLRDLTDFGSMENTVTTAGAVKFSLCRADGTAYGAYAVSATPPEAPGEGTLWLDLSDEVPVLRAYRDESWAVVSDTCVRLQCAGIGAGFQAGDGVEVSGCSNQRLNGVQVLRTVSDDAVVMGGIISGDSAQTEPLTLRRRLPEMDFVVECGNRLWGCKYGVAGGRAVNEIYASKLGDFKNWSCYQGLATDSYAAARGSDGPFTGAAVYLGSPLFFKERCIERVYPAAGGAHQIVTLDCPGVAQGSHKSLCSVDGTLFYHGPGGVYAFDGSLPTVVSQMLGQLPLRDGVAGAWEGKYYLSVCSAGLWQLLVYDSRRGLWHREDGLQVTDFAQWNGELYALCSDGRILSLHGKSGKTGEQIFWLAESGELGLESAEHKYPMRLSLRLRPQPEGWVKAALSYDGGLSWEEQGTVRGRGGVEAAVLHLRPRRSAQLRLRLTGGGACTVYSLSAVYEKGSDGA